MKRSRRLETGVAVFVLLTLGCVIGPWLPVTPRAGDPARAALLPPGTEVTEIVLRNGRTVVSPTVETEEDRLVVGGPHGVTTIDLSEVAAIRHARFWLGSDRFGRDVLTRLAEGGRISISVAALAALVALLIGSVVGLAAATCGRWADAVLMRLADGLMAFPVLFFLILIAALFKTGPLALVLILGLSSWMGLARLVRGQALSLRGRPFVLAARAAGSTTTTVWRRHLLPNMAGPVSQDTALRLGDLVLAEATLSFLGLGLPPGMASWGSMVAQGHRVMVDGWWLATFAGAAIALLVISLALIGDGIQERLSRSE